MSKKTLQEMQPLADVLNVDIVCDCGQTHRADIDAVLIGRGAIDYVPELLEQHGMKTVLMLEDTNTHEAAGAKVADMIQKAGLTVYEHIFDRGNEWLCADDHAIAEGIEVFNACPQTPDVVIAVGSGTLNDLGKAISDGAGKVPQWIIGTAASMDGYASTVAALTLNNMKTNGYFNPPKVIIGDTAIMCKAPRSMTVAGIGDMAAKYNAGLDWKLSHLLTGEYYCEFVAKAMLDVTDRIIDLALAAPEEGEFADELIESVMEGLVLSGVYMSYMGSSRAASGSEHHFSHFWEMWLQLNNKPAIYHGAKVGVGTLIMDRLYREFLTLDVEARRVIPRLKKFDAEKYQETLKKVYGAAAPEILAAYHYDAEERIDRLNKILENRRTVNAIIREALPSLDKMRAAMKHVGAIMDWTGLDHITGEVALQALLYCKEMRPHYTMLQMMQDVGYNIKKFAPNMVEAGYLRLDQIQMRDPFVLPVEEEGKYYLFGTTDPSCWRGPFYGFDCFVSEDLEHWQGPIAAFRPKDNFWANRNDWAPEVHRYRGKYYMFATFGSDKRYKGTQILKADKPEGPYNPISAGPITPEEWDCLDGTFYVDENEQPWMVFCHEWTQIIDGEVVAVPLKKDLTGPAGEPVSLFAASEASWTAGVPWKVRHPEYEGDALSYVTDGPFMVQNGDELIMLWSSRGPKGYAMGSAYSLNGLMGPWKQNDALAFEEDGGHGMVFKTFEGQLMMTVHQPNQTPHERPKFFPAKIENHAIVLEGVETEAAPEVVEKKIVSVKDKMPYWLL
jgi:glycerol dehydrogenase-like iron-containing ADH family enzyme/GH43 family beta-xylosidase